MQTVDGSEDDGGFEGGLGDAEFEVSGPKIWVTYTIASIGAVLLVYGLLAGRLDYEHGVELFVLIGGILGLGRKMDRLHRVVSTRGGE